MILGCEKHSEKPESDCQTCKRIGDLAQSLRTLYEAVAFCLDWTQADPDFGYYSGPGTEVFRRLCLAEAAYKQVPLSDVEARRSKQNWSADPEIVRCQRLLDDAVERSESLSRIEELDGQLTSVRAERDEYAKALDEFSAILDGKRIEDRVQVVSQLCDGKTHNGVVLELAHLLDDFAQERKLRIDLQKEFDELDKERLWILQIASTRLDWSKRWKRLARRLAARVRRAAIRAEYNG